MIFDKLITLETLHDNIFLDNKQHYTLLQFPTAETWELLVSKWCRTERTFMFYSMEIMQ